MIISSPKGEKLNRLFLSNMQGNDGKSKGMCHHFIKAGIFHLSDQTGTVRKTGNAGAEVEVGIAIPGKPAGNPGKNTTQVQIIKGTKPQVGLAELQNDEAATGTEHPVHFPESFCTVRQVAQTKGNGDQIKALILKRQSEAVPMQKLIGWFPKPANTSFPAGLLQHRLAKIQPGKINLIPKTITQGKKNIPAPGGKIENILRTAAPLQI